MGKITINRCLFVLALLLSNPVICREMVLAPPGIGAQTVTRDVAEYTSRERDLIAMINGKENVEPALLADDFEVWSDKSSDWQSKADWLKTVKQPQADFNIRNLSVRLMDDFAVVSFLLEKTEGKRKKHSTQFVIDVWRRSAGKLMVRYVSDAASSNPVSSWPDRKFATIPQK